jgi:hypothetical protein
MIVAFIMRKRNPLFILLGLLFSFHVGMGQHKFVKTKVSEDVRMMLPETLFPMTDEEIASKYLSSRKPMATFASMDKAADFALNSSTASWAGNDMEMMKKFYKSTIANLHTDVQFITEEVRNINNRDFLVFEFIARVSDEGNTVRGPQHLEKYNYIQYTVVNGRALIFNFSCPAKQKDKWRESAETMMNSVKIKR